MSLIIRQSAIHSRGCYTTEPIKKNALIIEYVGPHLTNKEANDLYDDYEQTYLFGLENGKTIIDGIGVAAFINHSCRPNCRTDEFHRHIWIIADRNIKPGEELTYDYSLYDGDGDAPCRCGAPDCRGTMYDEDELKKARKKKKEAGKKQRPVNGKRLSPLPQ